MIRVMIADDNEEWCQIVAMYFAQEKSLELVGIVHDGEAVLANLNVWKPDLLLLDVVMPVRDGLEVLEKLAVDHQWRPKILVMSAFGHDHAVSRATELGADYYLMKPFSLPTLVKRIREIVDAAYGLSGVTDFDREKYACIISSYFARLGVPPHYKGYRYLLEAVLLVSGDRQWLDGVTKRLYPEIGTRCGASAVQVERAIRHAVEVTWEKGNLHELQQLFPVSVDAERGKPTNSFFIAKIANLVKLELSKAN